MAVFRAGRLEPGFFGQNSLFIELQIWRLTGDGVYTKVGYTTINTTRSNSELYEYPLSSPLPFQAGDVLGYYQPEPSLSQSSLLLVRDRRENQLEYLYSRTSPANSLNINSGNRSSTFQLFVNIVTGKYCIFLAQWGKLNLLLASDPPGCGRGFMSVERMRLSLNRDSVSLPTITPSQRQQISPEMRFTCDGNITKWIIGADYDNRYGENDNLYPELQIWRKDGDETYEKISGTFIEAPTLVNTRIYEYDNFSPIPVKSGDILGIFIPRLFISRLRLISEDTNSPTQYYQFTDESATVSPHNVFDIGNQFVITSSYHPLVSVEFVRSPTSSVMILPSSSLASTATIPLPTSRAHVPSTDQPSSSSSGQSSAAIAAGGVAVALVLLMVALLLVILVVFVMRRRQDSKPLENVEHKGGFSPLGNPVYTGKQISMMQARVTKPLHS
jgi:hypothetical protein